jgi:hypothetical protein
MCFFLLLFESRLVALFGYRINPGPIEGKVSLDTV